MFILIKTPIILEKIDLNLSWAPSPFWTPCSGWNLGLLYTLRALPGSAPVALPEPVVQIPFPPNTSNFTTPIPLFPLSTERAKINISRTESEVEQSWAEINVLPGAFYRQDYLKCRTHMGKEGYSWEFCLLCSEWNEKLIQEGNDENTQICVSTIFGAFKA